MVNMYRPSGISGRRRLPPQRFPCGVFPCGVPPFFLKAASLPAVFPLAVSFRVGALPGASPAAAFSFVVFPVRFPIPSLTITFN